MTETDIHPQSKAVSLWEVAYSDAWYHFHATYLDILKTLNNPNFSLEDRPAIVGKLGQLILKMYKIERTGLTMYKMVPGCQTVNKEPMGFFASAFSRQCLVLLQNLDTLTRALMADTQPDQVIYRALFELNYYQITAHRI
jgi:hypothetical protein